jgi:MFS family permease
MTMATGLATSFVTMGLARIGVGVGEAFLHPLAVSLVSDTVPPQKRARAFSYYLSAGALGSIIALLFGGLLIRKLMRLGDLSLPIFGKLEPWEGLFIAAALLGFLFSAVVIVTMRDPQRQGLSGHKAPGHARSALDFVKAHPRLCWALFAGISLLQMAAYTMTMWNIVFFERVHHWSGADAAVWLGSIGGASTLIGCLAGGRLIEWLRRRGHADAPLRLCVISGLCYGTFCIAGLLAPNPYLAIGCFALSLFWAYVPSVAGFSAMAEILPPRTRAQLAGLHTLTNGLIANSLGPFLVGFLSDRLFRDEVGIRYAMSATVAIAAVTGLLSVIGGLRPYRDRLNRGDVESADVQSKSRSAAAATT